MARIRTVKPDLFKHEDLYDAEVSSGLPLRLSFIGLFTCCDREGRFKWKPRALKTDVLPYDDVDFSRVLDALWTRGFVVKYGSEDDLFGCIPSFPAHQVINNRESESNIPEPNENNILHASGTRKARVRHAASGEGKGREGKGREKEGEGLRATRLPREWVLPIEWAEWSARETPAVNTVLEAAKFRDYWVAKAGKDGAKNDWPATWRNWCRRIQERARPDQQSKKDQLFADFCGGSDLIEGEVRHVGD